MVKSDLSRYRTQLTQAEALELCEILDSVPEMSLALLKLHSKLKIFVAQVQFFQQKCHCSLQLGNSEL